MIEKERHKYKTVSFNYSYYMNGKTNNAKRFLRKLFT